jgi:ribosomal protein S1
MSEEKTFEQMLEESLVSIHRGEIITGTVIGVNEDEIYVNIGYKSDGVLPKSEYSNYPSVKLLEEVKEGDAIRAKVLKVNDGDGQVLLTYKRLQADEGLKKVEELYKSKEEITAKVNLVLGGGLVVIVHEVRVFIPASLISDSYVTDLQAYKDQEITFVITEYNTRKNRIIGNCRTLIEAKKNEHRDEIFGQFKVGDILDGTVKNITDYGAFVNVNGVDGLAHISELSWGRVKTPKDVVKVGDVVKVKVINVNADKKKISLSMKFDDENPWNIAEDKYAIGNVVNGKVARMTDFGAFIELEIGVDALLHVSQISVKHVEKPQDVLNVGDIIEAKITEFDLEQKKISLSIKALELEKQPTEEASTEEAPTEELPVEELSAEEDVVEDASADSEGTKTEEV